MEFSIGHKHTWPELEPATASQRHLTYAEPTALENSRRVLTPSAPEGAEILGALGEFALKHQTASGVRRENQFNFEKRTRTGRCQEFIN